MIDIGLKAIDIENINVIFSQHKAVEKVIVYGSRARGDYKPFSDIDLAIKGENMDDRMQQEIENDLDDLLLPNRFDLSVYEKISDKKLLEHIDVSGKTLYSRVNKK